MQVEASTIKIKMLVYVVMKYLVTENIKAARECFQINHKPNHVPVIS